ncbi:23S rRNA (adenine(2030)-N(6))-methyltransferase RlmJ [Rhodoferax sediminis]|uniref:Ribosomal RNA large subunit methyltransferase J n=1 Tax=Rhodoferax sediminis TaxID=2509614 RepID=A0A515D7A6_9BURK|nr:23S rRNA (adenine(2030)-N(6))-methyltransferase RlmJ [Rhodoferax sediminis]QDL36266.1 23S rRNA (adenine(2030)-N(6))-methyltransferase RlmJ [Rhodoferax sediminis]
MFSYRHAFHAGNHADVLKHMTLIATLEHLTQKDAGLTVIDTHAGAGLYRLDSDYADKSSEARDGVIKLFAQIRQAGVNSASKVPPALTVSSHNARKSIVKQAAGSAAASAPDGIAPALEAYLDLVASFNPSGQLKIYPGSPFVIQRLLRVEARDKLKLFELHPTDSKTLAANIAQLEAGRQVAVARLDGFEGLKAFLPPPNRRALVLIDPSYELKTDYARVSACILDSLKRFSTGTYAVWYPVIPRPEAHDLPRRLKTLATQAKKPWLHATLAIGADLAQGLDDRPGLRASGMFLINPPHTLKAALAAALPQVLQVLGRGQGKGYTLEAGG